MPRYRDATYGGETVTLANPFLRLEVHKRLTGWGWGELFVLSGQGEKFVAVLEHLAEAHCDGQPYPLRLEAKEYRLEQTDCGQTLSFTVQPQEVEPPDKTFEGQPAFKGTVTLTLPNDEARIYYKAEIEPQFLIYLRRIRGLWLRVGADSFGTARHDAIFPGVEWVIGDEWSSGTDWFEHPKALRVAPHPHKVAFPLMAISYDGIGIGVSWTPDLTALSHLTRLRCPQPVFATPNFVDRRPQHLLGLMWPSARWGLKENALEADPPLEVRKGTRFVLDAQISIVRGTSLDVVLDWVKQHGMPDPGAPRYEWQEALDRIATAYNSSLWVEGEGWRGDYWAPAPKGRPVVPRSVDYYIEHGRNRQLAAELKRKADWCRTQTPKPEQGWDWRARPFELIIDHPERAEEVGNALLALQTPEGDFPFDPQGIHKTNLLDWAAFWRPLGQPGDSSVDLCAMGAGALILAGQKTGEKRFLDAAHRTLEFAMRFERPEGGDWWETPFHSPNLLAAGHAAIAYYLGYRQFSDERYLARAKRWIRSVIPFTHLWQPADVPMIYNTKPCLNSTCWYLSDWVSKHVQWEILLTFDHSERLGINWAQIDPEVDWDTYQRGVTCAVQRWMIQHDDPQWMFNCEYPERAGKGDWDTLFTDTFDPVANTYGGGPIGPELIAQNVIIVLNHQKK